MTEEINDASLVAAAPLSTVTIPEAEYLALTDERRHWRETAVCKLHDLMRAATGERRLSLFGPKVPRSVIFDVLRSWTDDLAAALSGEIAPLCEGCGKPIRPGDIEFPYNDVSAHADCDHPRPGKHFAGEVVKSDHVVTEGPGGEEIEGPGEVTLFAATALYTDEQIADALAKARAFLTAGGAA